MTLPLHTKFLRPLSQKLIAFILQLRFFGLNAFGEPFTVFHAVLLIYGLGYLVLLNPLRSHQHEERGEELIQRMARWHRERNMYIAAFIWVVYFMIYQYYLLRSKYDDIKKKAEAAGIDVKSKSSPSILSKPGPKYGENAPITKVVPDAVPAEANKKKD